jgi:hypothetical protein
MLTFSELGRYGRLGNQMFQIAGVIGLAKKHGYKFGFPYWMNHDHKERFGSAESIDIQSFFRNPLPMQELSFYQKYFVHWGYHNFNTLADNLDIQGHLQSEKYFEHCKDLIRYYFEFKEEVEPLPEGAIALHVRRGDYDNGYHPFQETEYYQKALERLPIGPVYVFSDSPDEAKQMLGDDLIYVKGNHYIKDLQLMTTATHHILSNSTLCWWGWWLSKQEGKVIAPAKWFGPQAGLSSKDIYTEKMIVI